MAWAMTSFWICSIFCTISYQLTLPRYLESNSAGQYYWLEAHTDAPITSALCNLLSGAE